MATYDVNLFDFQTLTDTFTVDPPYEFSDSLTVTNTFTYDHINTFSQILTLIEAYTFHINTVRTLTDTPILKNIFSGYTNNPFTIQNPIPTVGNPDTNTQPDTGASPGPGLGPFSMGLLRYEVQTIKFVSPLGPNMIFKAPDFGDKDSHEPHFITENTRNLFLIQYRDSIWGSFKTFELGFTQLDQFEADNMRFFLRVTCGLALTYTDIYGNDHIGVITTPDAAITSSASGYSVKITFLEGVLA